MNFVDFNTGVNDEDRRLDKIIRNFLPDLPLSNIYSLIRKNLIRINKKKTSPEYKIQKGDVLNIAEFILQPAEEKSEKENLSQNYSHPHIKTAEPADEFPEILFRNEHILIINKPYDISVQGSDKTLDKIVQKEYLENKAVKKESLAFIPGPLHRLDRKTTGVLAFSQSLKGARWFCENLADHKIHKKYAALFQGNMNEEKWEDFISKEEFSGSKKGFHTVKVSDFSDAHKKNEKTAVTYVKPVAKGMYHNIPVTLALVDIKTGRTHQIRAQSSFHAHPLLGDTAYGGIKISENDRDFYLHAVNLIFPENELGIPQTITAPLENDFILILKTCGIGKIELY